MTLQTRPAVSHAVVVPSDAAADNFPTSTRAIYVGGGGTVIVVMGGVAVSYLNVPNGALLRVQADRIHATGTTATNMVAQW